MTLLMTTTWKALEDHSQIMQLKHINNLERNSIEEKSLTIEANNISIDFSKQLINENTLELLFKLAEEKQLSEKIQALVKGDIVNLNELKPALHTALRIQNHESIKVNGENIIPLIWQTRAQIEDISNAIREKRWLGFSGKPICDIINIGIGGSDLGPKFCFHALKKYIIKNINFHFISDVDPDAFTDITDKLNPETTLFIISSKSFTTKETLHNAKKAFDWLGKQAYIKQHVIAVSANIHKARQLGIKHILPIWDWIGGRYSACSAINLITAIGIGFADFSQMLSGANAMDIHFQNKDFRNNLPILLGLVGIWNNNFLGIHNLLILCYAKQFEYFLPYIQQLEMESNGKSLDIQGCRVSHATSPIIWGGLGNQAQHSYYQLLCQGTHKISLDLLTLRGFEQELIHSMCMIKKDILAYGFFDEENKLGYIPGNNPLNHIHLADDSPFTIGALIALYEHKVYVQSVIWNINPFNQPGVESIKKHALKSHAYMKDYS